MTFILLLYSLFASVFVIAKIGLEYTQPFFLVGSRMAMAGLILIAYQIIVNRESFQLRTLPWLKILGLGVLNIYLTNVFEFWGLQYLTSSKTCLIYSISPFASALISYLVLSEKMNWKKWLGLTVGCLGLVPILLSDNAREEQGGLFFMFSWAEIAVLAAAICSVYGWILLRQIVKQEKVSPVTANGFSMLIGGSLSLFHSSLVETWNPWPFTEFYPFLESAILLIIISNLICYNLYGALLKRYSATFMSFAGFTTPFFTALFGWLFLSETISWPFYLSTTILFFGLFLFYQEELQTETLHISETKPSSAQ